MKKVILFLSLILLSSCFKEYHPEKEAYRDKELFGTWYYLENTESYPILEIFTKDGYMGKIYFVDNYSKKKSLGAIYSTNSTNDIIYEHGRFRNGSYSREVQYKKINSDTLLLGRTLETHIQPWDTLVRYKHQLIYDGPNLIEIDSIK